MLTIVHSNHAKIDRGVLSVDRKFHLGMQTYLENIRDPIVSIHPESRGGESTMDMIELPTEKLGYKVMTVSGPDRPAKAASDQIRMLEQISRSGLVYGGGLNSEAISARLRIPQIAILEYDLMTQITVAATAVANPVRKLVRAARSSWNYRRNLGVLRHAAGLHCNGYPIYDAMARHHTHRLLYLDSRMYRSMVIPDTELHRRLVSREALKLKLLFSGRFEPMKGALECVRVGLACLERGLDIELHCYGQGSQAETMRKLASTPAAKGKIFIHQAVTYPELVQISRAFDVFVCCHVQADPSCTYLESFGSGLPIVGYANTMWRRLCQESHAGFASSSGRPEMVANDIGRLIREPELLDRLSVRAREFALQHAFEAEFKLRTDDINLMLRRPVTA